MRKSETEKLQLQTCPVDVKKCLPDTLQESSPQDLVRRILSTFIPVTIFQQAVTLRTAFSVFQLQSLTGYASIYNLISCSGSKAGGGSVRATSPGKGLTRLFAIIVIMCLARTATGARVVGVTMAPTGVSKRALLNSHTILQWRSNMAVRAWVARFHQFVKNPLNGHVDAQQGRVARGSGSLMGNFQGRWMHLPLKENSILSRASSKGVADCM